MMMMHLLIQIIINLYASQLKLYMYILLFMSVIQFFYVVLISFNLYHGRSAGVERWWARVQSARRVLPRRPARGVVLPFHSYLSVEPWQTVFRHQPGVLLRERHCPLGEMLVR